MAGELSPAEVVLVLESRARAQAAAASGGKCPFGHGSAPAPAAPASKSSAPKSAASVRAVSSATGSDHELGHAMRRSKSQRMMEPLNYADYLQLNKIIGPGSQDLMSTKAGFEAHDEHLFIVIHQTCVVARSVAPSALHRSPRAHALARIDLSNIPLPLHAHARCRSYELWFKQILWELDSVRAVFMAPAVEERSMGIAVGRLVRITEILRILVQQLTVLETMTPVQFLTFRDFLFPASGFQSKQFRLLENKLGLKKDSRLKYGGKGYCTYLRDDEMRVVEQAEKEPSMHDLLDEWLSRMPFLQVSVLLFTVTFYANHAHNLTRCP
jgi:tryptophan 2,3-dioxygenase